jgi:hypothetical protein
MVAPGLPKGTQMEQHGPRMPNKWSQEADPRKQCQKVRKRAPPDPLKASFRVEGLQKSLNPLTSEKTPKVTPKWCPNGAQSRPTAHKYTQNADPEKQQEKRPPHNRTMVKIAPKRDPKLVPKSLKSRHGHPPGPPMTPEDGPRSQKS